MELDMVADMEVDKVADMAAEEKKNGRHGVGHGRQHTDRQSGRHV